MDRETIGGAAILLGLLGIAAFLAWKAWDAEKHEEWGGPWFL